MSERGTRKTLSGKIVSDKMDKTVVVEVSSLVQHPIYKKFIRRRKRYKAHDGQNEFQIGDTVTIEETRPMSKDKRWRVSKLIERPVRA
jgi:small subunit ribosomal protein S17